jgi:diguanylate cyclase (GGDEF)-like protein
VQDGAARETSGATTCLIIRYVRELAGDEGVEQLLARAAVPYALTELEDERRWFTYEAKVALFDAAAAVLDDPDVTRHIGESALQHQVGAGLRVLLRTLGSPRVVISNIAKTCPKFSTVARMEVVELGRDHARVTYELDASKTPHRLDCLLNQGLMAVIGPLFGQPLLEIAHPECQVLGAPRCVYDIRWSRRRWRRRRARVEFLEEQVRALSSQLTALQSTAADLVSPDALDEVLDRIVSRASVAVRANRFLLAVRLGNGRLSVHGDGYLPDHARHLAERLLQPDASLDGFVVRPVASATRDYGVLAASLDDFQLFEEETALLDAYARSAAAALDAATALEDATNGHRQTTALLALASAVSGRGRPREIATRLAEAMPAALGGHASLVFLVEGERLRVRALHGWSSEHEAILNDLVVDRDTDPVVQAWIDEPGPSLVTADTESPTAQVLLPMLGVDALAMVPLTQRGTLLGVAGVAYTAETFPADVDDLMRRAGAVAGFAATALDNAKLVAELRHRAFHDPLTGLANRAHFEETVEQGLDRAANDGVPVSLVFVDVDNFKVVNDQFGHEAGDRLLTSIAMHLNMVVREHDLAARLGGDEFAVVLWDTTADDARGIAESLRTALRLQTANANRATTVSIGIASARPGETVQEILRRADQAMYEAKQLGRDLCVVEDSDG